MRTTIVINVVDRAFRDREKAEESVLGDALVSERRFYNR